MKRVVINEKLRHFCALPYFNKKSDLPKMCPARCSGCRWFTVVEMEVGDALILMDDGTVSLEKAAHP